MIEFIEGIERNKADDRIRKFPSAYELAILNAFFRKREKHISIYTAYKSEEKKSQIGCFMWKR